MVTVAMTVLPCACGGRLTRASLGGRAPGPTPPRRVVPPLPPTRPGGGSASRKAGGAWCPRRPAALRPLGWEGPRPWRPKGRPGVPWRRAPPGPRVRTREVSRRPPTRDNRLDPQATACATVSHGTDLPASRRGNPGSGAVSRASPRRPPPPRSWRRRPAALRGGRASPPRLPGPGRLFSGGSWRCSPWTTCVRLELPARVRSARLGVRGGARRRRAPRSVRSSGNRRARHLTREHVCQSDVLAG